MEKYLRAVGFTDIKTQDEFDKLIDKAYADCDKKNVRGIDAEDVTVECYKYFGDGLGVYLHGKMDENEKVTITECLPYTVGKTGIVVSGVTAEASYKGQNIVSFTDKKNMNQLSCRTLTDCPDIPEVKKIILSILSIKGTVLLPVVSHYKECTLRKEEDKRLKTLMSKAAKGDMQAAQALEEDHEQKTKLLNERIANEDFFSVVESYYEPDGDNPSVFSFLGSITHVRSIKNKSSGENVYKLSLDLSGTKASVFINQVDIIGMPMVGMRFWGSGVFQGEIIAV